MASGRFDGPYLQRFLIDRDVNLAPDAPLEAAVPARIPLPFTLRLDTGAVDQQV